MSRPTVAVLLGVAIAVSCAIHDGIDIDDAGYQQVVEQVRSGGGYYETAAETFHASQVRSIRPPTLFWLLAALPAGAQIPLTAAAWAATLILVGSLTPCRFGPWPLIVAAVYPLAASVWWGLEWYPEVYGLPFALAGLRRSEARWWLAAACFRELYAVGLLVGWVASRRRSWLLAGAGAAGLWTVHAWAASRHVSPAGWEEPFGSLGHGWQVSLTMISPSPGWIGWTIGVAVMAAAVWRWRTSPTVAVYVILGAAGSVWSTRAYWLHTWVAFAVVLAFSERAGRPAETPALDSVPDMHRI